MRKIAFLFTMLFAVCFVLAGCGDMGGTTAPSTYKITFDSDGGSGVAAIVAEAGAEIAAPTNPTKEGFNFVGWYLGEVEYEFSVMPETNITLKAKWEEVETPVVEYTITLDVNGGDALENATITLEAGAEITLPVPTREGYNFLGWYNGEDKFEESVMPEENVTLVAKWEEKEIVPPTVQYTITLDVNGGNPLQVSSITAEAGATIELPTPTREGYNFLGWLFEGALFSETVMPEANIALVASWEEIPGEKVEVTYVLNGGYANYASYAAMVADFAADFTTATGRAVLEDGSNFFNISWMQDGTSAGYNFLVNPDYSAKWGWMLKVINEVRVARGAAELTATDGQAEARGEIHNLLNLCAPGEKNGNASFGSDYSTYEAYAKIEAAMGGAQYKAEVEVGKALLENVNKIGYSFAGWYSDEALSNKVTSVSEATTLYAKWEKVYVTLTYVLNNNDASITNTTVKVHVSDKFALETPVFDAKNYLFNGWFSDEALSVKASDINYFTSTDITVYGSWTSLDGFVVTYNLSGGNWYFSSHDELVEQFITEYNTVTGKSVTADNFYSGAGNGVHVFYDNQEMFNKWSWILKYFHALGEEKIGYHSESQGQYKTFLEGKGSTVSVQWAPRQNIQGFLTKTQAKKYSSAAAIDFSNQTILDRFWDYLNESQETVKIYDKETTLPTPKREFFEFAGWYDNPELSGNALTSVSSTATLYAKWVEENPVTSITITNKVEELKLYQEYQLEWAIDPVGAGNQTVAFSSSDKTVATVSETGLITMVGLGTVTITITSLSSSKASDTVSFNVYEPGHFNTSYETNSYVTIGGEVKLLAEYVNKDQSNSTVTWSSLNSDIATVNDGVVKGVKEGLATIRASVSETVYFDFVVTVLPETVSAALQFVVNSHYSNIVTSYNLAIGSGTPAYYADILGSVSNIFYNHELEINDEYLAAGNASGDYYANSNVKNGLEFITVHYTAGFDSTADTDNHASYFSSGSADVSIHYVTGNKGSKNGEATSEVYHTLDHAHGAWHAGDSNGRYHSNSTKEVDGLDVFQWMPTGVAYDGTDLLEVKFSASNDFYYEINGKKTTIKLPETWNYKERNSNHIYNADGTISSQSSFTYSWAKFENRTPESFFDAQGFPVKVVNGEYYMGPTWWSYGQVVEGRICAFGGNNNSIGIESCVNKGSDLWYTWQVTSQLVAKLMNDNNLTIDRVKGHHFFDGKDCPQPLLENDMALWNEFIKMVKAEYELLTTYKDVEFGFEVVNGSNIVSENGRVVEQPEFNQVVTYTVTVGGETITLATMVEGIYNK